MKKIIVFILSLCIVLSLSACDAAGDVFSFNIEDEKQKIEYVNTDIDYTYVGKWVWGQKFDECYDREITINSVVDTTIEFDVFYYRIWGADDVLATIKSDNKAYFKTQDGVEGNLYISDNKLIFTVTKSEVPYVEAETITYSKDTSTKSEISDDTYVDELESTEVDNSTKSENSHKNESSSSSANSSRVPSSSNSQPNKSNSQTTSNSSSENKGTSNVTNNSQQNTSSQAPTHTHSYSQATCTTQPTCSCGSTRGNALGHDYSEDPIKCQRCAETLILKVDDKIKFGKYDWYVLEVTSDKAFLLCKSYVGTSDGLGGTWENSDVRTYLNNDFYNGFSATCKNRILSVEIKNPNNPNGVSGGNPTVDKIFLLSYEEFNQYLTPSMASLGVDWWLRTPGSRTSYNYTTDYYTAYVENDGTLTLDGLFVFSTGYLRPAMWIDLS